MIPHGAAVEKEVFEAEVAAFRPAVVFVCHGESSTGVVQPLYGLGEICQKHVRLSIPIGFCEGFG